MKVYVGFSKPNKFMPFAWLIQQVESRQYDHVYIRVQDSITSQWMIFQASGLAVNMVSSERFFSGNSLVKEYEIDISGVQHLALWTFINNNLGVPYSLMEDLGIL